MSKDLQHMARKFICSLGYACALILLMKFSPAQAEKGSAVSALAFTRSLSAAYAFPPRHLHASAAISFTFSVDKPRPNVNDSLIYTITVWNDPLQSDTLRAVAAEFDLPRLANGSFALKLSSFSYAGALPFTVDPAQGKIIWQVGNIVRRRPPQRSDTARVVFAFQLAGVGDFSLSCGENPVTAFARVSFADDQGGRIFPGTPRAAESTLFLTPDFVADNAASNAAEVQRGDTLVLQYFFRNLGNVGRRVNFCLRFPPGLDSGQLAGVTPDSIGIPAVLADSICLDLGFVPAGSARNFLLRIFVNDLPVAADSLCFNGQLVTDCDIQPDNNFFRRTCVTVAPLDLLAVEKPASRNRLRVGDTLRYTLDFSNLTSRLPAFNVTLTDTLPEGVDFISATLPYTLSNRVLTWQRPQLPAGAREAVDILVRLRPDFFLTVARGQACNGANLTNVANLAATAANGSPSSESQLQNNRALHTAFVEPLGDLLEVQLAVSAAPPATLGNLMPGDTLLYQLTYSNRNQNLAANNVTLLDTLPLPAYLQLLSPPAGFVFEVANNLLRRENFILAAGESQSTSYRMILRNDIALCSPAVLGTRAVLFEPNGGDCQLQNNRAHNDLTFPAPGNLLTLSVQTANAVLPGAEFDVILQAQNLNDLAVAAVIINNTFPPSVEIVAINDGGAISRANQISWNLGALAGRQNRSISFRGRVRNALYCAPATMTNIAWLQSTPRDCNTADDTLRTAITILPTPVEEQLRLVVTNVRTRDRNGDGCAEPGERIVAQMTLANRNPRNLTAQNLAFLNACAFIAGDCSPMTLIDLSPPVILPNDSAIAAFEFILRKNDFSAPTITLSFNLNAAGFCPQFVEKLALTDLRYCPLPAVVLRLVDLNDANGDGDGLASENEPLNLIVIAENIGPLPADSVDLFVALSPAGFTILQSNKPLPPGMPMRRRSRLAPNERDSLFLQLRYDSFSASEAAVAASAYLQVSALAGPQPPLTDQLLIRKDCYARPNPFIPTRHHGGVLFAPNDGQSVEIFDLQGNLLRSFAAPGPWDGRDDRGRLCEPGLYIWKIAKGCQGSIVVVR